MVTGVRCDADMRIVVEAFQNRRFIAHCHIQRAGKLDIAFLARIHAALENDVADQFIVSNAQTFDDSSPVFAFGMNYRQFDFGEPEHRYSRPLSSPASTISAARNTARALFCVSIHSLSGTESATMPAPACTYSVLSLTTAVRSAIARSMSPLKPR